MDASVSTPFDRGRGAIATEIMEGSLLTRLACTKRAADAPVTRSPRGPRNFFEDFVDGSGLLRCLGGA